MLYNIGDKIITKKQHPCGGREWQIVRTGADVKIKCLTCGHVVMFAADGLHKKIKKHIKADTGAQDGL